MTILLALVVGQCYPQRSVAYVAKQQQVVAYQPVAYFSYQVTDDSLEAKQRILISQLIEDKKATTEALRAQSEALQAVQSLQNPREALRATPPGQALIEQHCIKCHGAVANKGDFRIDRTLSLPERFLAIDALESHEMPKGSKLSDEDRQTLVSYLRPTREELKAQRKEQK